jgi:hypothetical protein
MAKVFLGLSFAGSVIEAFDMLLSRGIIPVSSTINHGNGSER